MGRTYQQLYEGGLEEGGGGEVVKSGVEAEQLVGESENHMVGSCKEGITRPEASIVGLVSREII